MPKATWNGAVIAQSDATVMVEGNHYFPPDAVDRRYLQASDRTSVCPWKGVASYYDVVVDGQVNSGRVDLPDPKDKAAHITTSRSGAASRSAEAPFAAPAGGAHGRGVAARSGSPRSGARVPRPLARLTELTPQEDHRTSPSSPVVGRLR
jgi:hypothetical protein